MTKGSRKRKLVGITVTPPTQIASSASKPIPKTNVFHSELSQSGRLRHRRTLADRPPEDDDDAAGPSNFGDGGGPEPENGLGEDAPPNTDHHIPPKRKRTREWGNDNGVRDNTFLMLTRNSQLVLVAYAALAGLPRRLPARASAS